MHPTVEEACNLRWSVSRMVASHDACVWSPIEVSLPSPHRLAVSVSGTGAGIRGANGATEKTL